MRCNAHQSIHVAQHPGNWNAPLAPLGHRPKASASSDGDSFTDGSTFPVIIFSHGLAGQVCVYYSPSKQVFLGSRTLTASDLDPPPYCIIIIIPAEEHLLVHLPGDGLLGLRGPCRWAQYSHIRLDVRTRSHDVLHVSKVRKTVYFIGSVEHADGSASVARLAGRRRWEPWQRESPSQATGRWRWYRGLGAESSMWTKRTEWRAQEVQTGLRLLSQLNLGEPYPGI